MKILEKIYNLFFKEPETIIHNGKYKYKIVGYAGKIIVDPKDIIEAKFSKKNKKSEKMT